MNHINKYILEQGVINLINKYKELRVEEILKIVYDIIKKEPNLVKQTLCIKIYIIISNYFMSFDYSYYKYSSEIQKIVVKLNNQDKYLNNLSIGFPWSEIKKYDLSTTHAKPDKDIYKILSDHNVKKYNIIFSVYVTDNFLINIRKMKIR
jgi:hypothetical protein